MSSLSTTLTEAEMPDTPRAAVRYGIEVIVNDTHARDPLELALNDRKLDDMPFVG